MTTGKTIRNVNILDMRKATAESVAEIEKIGNANIVMYSPETAGLVTRLNIGNLNLPIEIGADVKYDLIFSEMIIGKDFFANLKEPAFLIIFGQAVFEPTVTAENIEEGIAGMVVMGQLVCPEHLQGAIQSKGVRIFGQTKAYPALKQSHKGSLELDLAALQTLEDQSELAVLGSLTLPDVLPDDLLAQKILKLFVLNNVRCHAENAMFIKTHLAERSAAITVIPEGFTWIEKPLVLDSTLLQSLKLKKLYCKERVQIDPEVTPAELDDHLETILGDDLILCPAALKASLVKKCDLLKNRVVFYEGMLLLVEDELTLQPSYLEALEDKATLVVTGELTIAPEIEVKDLASRLAKVHNLGTIRCIPQQMGVIQTRLGLQEGTLEDSTHKEEPPAKEGSNQIDNVNFLVL